MAREDVDAHVSVFPVTSPTMRFPVRATVVQASTVFFDTPATLEKAEKLIVGAAAYGSQLVVFPETFVGGYPRCVRFDATNLTEEDDGPEVGRLAKIADKYKGQHLRQHRKITLVASESAEERLSFSTWRSNGDAALDAITCAGGSVIISPSGTILVGPNYHGECLISADLDLRDIVIAKTQSSGLAYHCSKFTAV
ncbi:hypothetical protein SADUNF_Sadunf06G0162900 [Salix dunnii]|uniref:CN hydrolase domain-containing protein n=1 Tax=Salix dunnii TaxID=1413687 RepID=A0A835JZF7_9ROSI|nr:hypothetical protein SADUNF_Sadunf06G0162900 [Salix dunnii]